MKLHLFSFVLAALMAGPAVAQGPVIWSGGVGIGERAEAPDTGTKLEFFARSGAFLADIRVTITDSEGREVVNTHINGPWLIVDLPDGEYRVGATVDGWGQSGAVIEAGSQRTFGIMIAD